MKTLNGLLNIFEPFNTTQTAAGAASHANKIASSVEEEEGCLGIKNAINDGTLLTQAQQVASEIMDRIEQNQDDDCFVTTFNNYKGNIINNINNRQKRFINKKKEFLSKIFDLDIRLEYLKHLNEQEEENQGKIADNAVNKDKSSNLLNEKKQNNINKRLALYYDKNIEILDIIYTIFYYIYILLFLLYLIFLIWYIYSYNIIKETTNISKTINYIKMRFGLIVIIFLIIMPLLINYYINKYLNF